MTWGEEHAHRRSAASHRMRAHAMAAAAGGRCGEREKGGWGVWVGGERARKGGGGVRRRGEKEGV